MGRNVLTVGAGESRVRELVRRAITSADAIFIKLREPPSLGDTVVDLILREATRADVVVLDDTSGSSHGAANLQLAIGAVQARELPAIAVTTSDSRIAQQAFIGVRTLVYDAFDDDDAFLLELTSTLKHALSDPVGFTERSRGRRKAAKTFISYSHADRPYLDRLLVHLRPLEREGLIDLWDDTRIHAGALWRDEIEAALERATIAVLLVSADFLASDFIVDNELPPLLQEAEATTGVRIIPLVLKPCRFLRIASLARLQAANDPAKPLILQTEGEREAVYDSLASQVEEAVGYVAG